MTKKILKSLALLVAGGVLLTGCTFSIHGFKDNKSPSRYNEKNMHHERGIPHGEGHHMYDGGTYNWSTDHERMHKEHHNYK